jgi:hypothetical protein
MADQEKIEFKNSEKNNLILNIDVNKGKKNF